jgi:protein TonB
MTTASRTSALFLIASLYGCGPVRPPPVPVARIVPPSTPPPAPYIEASPTLDAYKTAVAQHVVAHNPAHVFTGRLPPMLPAIVVLNITVDRTGHVTRLVVQRSRDPDASKVALASMARSGMLPAPHRLLAGAFASLTFSETFLFDRDYRFQLRSIAGPQ